MSYAVIIKNNDDGRELIVPKSEAETFYCPRGWSIVNSKEADANESQETSDQLNAEEANAEKIESDISSKDKILMDKLIAETEAGA